MSIDTIALFDTAKVSVTVEWLKERLEVNPPALAEVTSLYWKLWQCKTWMVETCFEDDNHLVGPGGFVLCAQKHSIEMYHMMRFGHFSGDPKSRHALRHACLFIANLVGSDRAIFTHELMPYEGETLDEIEAQLRKLIGAPATTFEELHAADHYGPRAWYIDTFNDLVVCENQLSFT